MRSLLAVLAALALAACQTSAPGPAVDPRAAPGEEAQAEAALAAVLAAAADPATDGAAFRPYVAFQAPDGSWRTPDPTETATAEARLAEVRAALDGAVAEDGRVAYEVEEYVVEPADGVTWHVLRVAFGDVAADAARATSEAEFGFVAATDRFLLLQVSQ